MAKKKVHTDGPPLFFDYAIFSNRLSSGITSPKSERHSSHFSRQFATVETLPFNVHSMNMYNSLPYNFFVP